MIKSRKPPESEMPPTEQNQLLAALPDDVRTRVFPHLQRVEMPLGSVIYESGEALSHAYFPIDSIVSLLYVMKNDDSAEIAMVGREGVVGVALFLGGNTSANRAIVQSAGFAYRLPAALLKKEFNRNGPFQHLMLRYAQALLMQMMQVAACNRHHTVSEQLGRWLLLSMDRLPTNTLQMTRGLIANMLGVRRDGVTSAAGKLQAEGAIVYSQGRFTKLNRRKLQANGCECHAAIKKEFDRLLPHVIAK